MILGSFVPSQVLAADVASFMDIDDSTKLCMASPRANVTLFSHRAIVRKFREFDITRNKITMSPVIRNKIFTKDQQCIGRSIPLDDNVELAQKQIIRFLKPVSEVGFIVWTNHDIDDKTVNELIRINLDAEWRNMLFDSCRITGKIKSLLARHPNKVYMYAVFAPTQLITNEFKSQLNPDGISLHPLNNDQISTAITDEFLKSLILKKYAVKLRGFLNLQLTFPAISRLFTEIVDEDAFNWKYGTCEMPCLGTIGYQEMHAALQYYQGRTWTKWDSTLCNINNSSYLEFGDIFTNKEESPYPTFGVSLERDVNGVVDNAVIPEELVDGKTFKRFNRLVKALDSTTSIESVQPKMMQLGYLRVTLWEHLRYSYLEIKASIRHQPNARNERSQDIEIKKANVDQSSTEDILVKIFKSCFSIGSLTLSKLKDKKNSVPLKITDRLFTSLLEHAVPTRVSEEWSMDIQLSAENMVRLRENQAAGLFQNLNIEVSDI